MVAYLNELAGTILIVLVNVIKGYGFCGAPSRKCYRFGCYIRFHMIVRNRLFDQKLCTTSLESLDVPYRNKWFSRSHKLISAPGILSPITRRGIGPKRQTDRFFRLSMWGTRCSRPMFSCQRNFSPETPRDPRPNEFRVSYSFEDSVFSSVDWIEIKDSTPFAVRINYFWY